MHKSVQGAANLRGVMHTAVVDDAVDNGGLSVINGAARQKRVDVLDSLELKDTGRYGLGVFATRDIEAGETLYDEGDVVRPRYTRREILEHPESKFLQIYSYIVDEDAYFTGDASEIEKDVTNYMNHSCDPNAWFEGDRSMTARRAIRRGEEVTCDYATFETEISFHRGLPCGCGAADCRRVLTGLEYRSAKFRAKYAGHLSSYIERLVRGPSWYDPRLYVRRITPEFRGVFTQGPVREGEVLACYSGKIVTYEELSEYSEEDLVYNLQVGKNLFQLPLDLKERETTDFINHSCEPNCGMSDSITVVALRDLEPDEEITIDYASFNSGLIKGSSDNFECACGAPGCRGAVRSDDWRRPRVRLRLARYFSPHIKQLAEEGDEPDDVNFASVVPPRS